MTILLTATKWCAAGHARQECRAAVTEGVREAL
jgi:hypothetical protein